MKNIKKENKLNANIKIFIYVFSYVFLLGLMIQLVVFPIYFPQLHKGDGLLIGTDSIRYHRIAVDKSAEIKSIGWSAWELSPRTYTPAGIASALYVLITPMPWTFLLVNASLKALGSVALYRTSKKLFGDSKIALYSIVPFVLFPSALQWDAQILNDGFAITGIFLLIDGIMSLIENRTNNDNNRLSFLEIILGILLFSIVRSYYLILLLPIPIFGLLTLISVVRKTYPETRRGSI